MSATLRPPVSARDHAEGPADAPLTLVEYGDYQCPYCGGAHPVVKRLQKTLGKKLRFVFRNFPLTQAHPYALIAAEAAEAAALQGRFWEMHDLVFEQQALLEPDIIPQWAESLGLDLGKLENDISRGTVKERIKRGPSERHPQRRQRHSDVLHQWCAFRWFGRLWVAAGCLGV